VVRDRWLHQRRRCDALRVITAINNPALLGSLGTVVGNASTGAITFYLGPLAGGPFAGQTIVGEGFGNVKIRQ
jgi:hypothetical protein